MPLPANIIAVSAFICEKLLRETDGVLTAVRLVDLFFVPELPTSMPDEATFPGPFISAVAVVSIKSAPGDTSEHLIEMKIMKPDGETKVLGEPTPGRFESRLGSRVPGGLTAAVQMNLNLRRAMIGQHYLCVSVDGEEVTRVPFTLLPQSAQATH